MSNYPATATLPDRAELLRRVTAVDNDPHIVEKFYPHILEHASQEKTGLGVALALALAAANYTADLPEVLGRVIEVRLPSYVRAIVDDPQVQADAIAALQ
jgi:hypothetical protein